MKIMAVRFDGKPRVSNSDHLLAGDWRDHDGWRQVSAGAMASSQQANGKSLRSTIVKPGTAQWRLWLGLGLSALGTVITALSIGRNLMFVALSVLLVMLGWVQLSLWSRLRRSWL